MRLQETRQQNNNTKSWTKTRPGELFCTNSCINIMSDYFDWQDIKYWSLIDRRDKRFLCIFNRACVFVLHLISFDERKFIHDTWTIIINKSKCSLWYLTDVIFNPKNCFCSFSLNKLFISVGGVPQLTFPRRTIWRPFYHKNVCFKNIT